ncbi:MAG: hypothetical protein ACREJ2_00675 [Planctomycetota bacterium]
MGKKFRGKDVSERSGRPAGGNNKKMRPRPSSSGIRPAGSGVRPAPAADPRSSGMIRRENRKTAPLEVEPEAVPDLEIGVGDTATLNALDGELDPVIGMQNQGLGGDPGTGPLNLDFEPPTGTTRRLTCTKCHADFEVDLAQVGKEIICPTCNNRFLLTSKDLQKQLDVLTQQVRSLQIQIDQANAQVQHFQGLAQSNRSKLEQAVAAGREVDAERERLAVELEKVQRQGLGGRAGPAVDEMRARLDTVEAQRKSLEAEVKDLRGKLQKHENRTAQLEKDNSSQSVELQLLHEKLAALEGRGASEADLEKLRGDLAQAKTKAADSNLKIQALERELDEAHRAQVSQAQSAGAAAESGRKVADLEKQLAQAKNNVAAGERKAGDLEKKVADAQSAAAEARRKAEELEHQLSQARNGAASATGAAQEQVQDLRNRIGELEEVANRRREELKALKEQQSHEKLNLHDLEKALEKARKQTQEQADEIAGLQRKLKAAEAAQQDGGKANAETEELRGKVGERDRTISEMNQKLHVKSEALEAAARELQEKGRHLGEREARLQELHGNISRREGEIRDLQHQLADKDHQIAEKMRHLGTLQQKVQDLERQLDESGRNRGAASEDLHKQVLDLKGHLAEAERQMAHADREHGQEIVRFGRELREALKQIGTLEGELAAAKQRLAAATSAATTAGGSGEDTAPFKAKIAELTAALEQERALVLDLKRKLTNGSDRSWAPVATTLSHNFGVIRVGGEKDDHDYFDVLFPRGTTLPKPGEMLTVKRAAYHPKHNIGNMQYMLATDIRGDQPAGDINRMQRVVFPFDKTIDPSGRYAASDTRLSTALDLVAETYFCNHDGVVTCEFERQGDGRIMRWSFSLVTLKSTN